MPKIMAQYPQIEIIGSIGSIVLGIAEVQVDGKRGDNLKECRRGRLELEEYHATKLV